MCQGVDLGLVSAIVASWGNDIMSVIMILVATKYTPRLIVAGTVHTSVCMALTGAQLLYASAACARVEFWILVAQGLAATRHINYLLLL